jgi:transcriptional regulator with XRE-family HTH domain
MLGRMLRCARERGGLSQEELAEAAGFDRAYPSLIERGLREPKLSTFIRLCNAAGVSPLLMLAELLTRQEKLPASALDETEPNGTSRKQP